MKPVQTRVDLESLPFILQGDSNLRNGLVIAQIAARVGALALYTVMGRIACTVPTTGTAGGGNTGDGTVTAVALSSMGPLPKAGTWTLTCVQAITNGGTFTLKDPDGVIVGSPLTLDGTGGAGGSATFVAGGLTFVITDGATDFIATDTFTIAVTASGKWAPFDPLAVNGAQIPRGVLLVSSYTEAEIKAGDVADVSLLVGGNCMVDAGQLVFDDGSTTLDTILTGGQTPRDYLQQLGIFPELTEVIDGFIS